MNITKLLTAGAFALALFASSAIGAEAKKYTAGSCCDKAQKKGETCAHKCCVEAEKKGEVCKKCNKE